MAEFDGNDGCQCKAGYVLSKAGYVLHSSEAMAAGEGERAATQFTCFTSTKVQILTRYLLV